MDWFKASLGVAVILVAHHLIKTDRIGFSAENYGASRNDKKFDDIIDFSSFDKGKEIAKSTLI